jgi:hypothetical protein
MSRDASRSYFIVEVVRCLGGIWWFGTPLMVVLGLDVEVLD